MGEHDRVATRDCFGGDVLHRGAAHAVAKEAAGDGVALAATQTRTSASAAASTSASEPTSPDSKHDPPLRALVDVTPSFVRHTTDDELEYPGTFFFHAPATLSISRS